MKIVKVDVILAKPVVPIFEWRPVVCRVYTDEGIYGDGEASIAYGIGGEAAFAMVKEFAKKVIGMDPMDTEVIWNKLYRETFWCVNGGPITYAGMSAIDIACWDIKGKALKKPLYKLLGGKVRDSLRSYASQLQLSRWEKDVGEWNYCVEPKDFYDATKRAIAEGYDCVKTDFLCGQYKGEELTYKNRTNLLPMEQLKFIEDRVAATREACGDTVDIIMENHCFSDAQSAWQLGKIAEKYNIFFLEEACAPSPKVIKWLGDRLKVPQASGERIYGRWQYAPYFEDGSLQVIQPDIGNCGGITEAKKICDMAFTYDVSVQAHACGTPMATDVAVHLECAIPNFQIHEHHCCNDTLRNKDMAIYNRVPVNGRIAPSEEPGIGNEIHPRLFKENFAFVTVK